MRDFTGYKRGMGLGGWLTNYKRLAMLPENKRFVITDGDLEHFDTYITENDVPAEVIEKEKEIAAAADPKLKDKPAAMLDKILSGKIRKFFSEVCLVDQPWVRDDKTTLAKLRPNCKVTRFVRWEVGEEL